MSMTKIRVNRNTIERNLETGSRDPAITATYLGDDGLQHTVACHELTIYGGDGMQAARVVYRPDDPLPCGSTLWIETDGEIDAD